VDAGALAVHGIEEAFLATQPVFAAIVAEFLEFVKGSELVIHNASFDVGFLNHELARLEGMPKDIRDICDVRDTLSLARRMHPGQRNSLDALAKRYAIDNSMRELHGALLDAKILAEVYLVMTGGQASLSLEAETSTRSNEQSSDIVSLDRAGLDLIVLAANDDELDAHDAMLERMRLQTGRAPIWDEIVVPEADNNPKSP
jgi:DNA polymerase-3 subunit epsilon